MLISVKVRLGVQLGLQALFWFSSDRYWCCGQRSAGEAALTASRRLRVTAVTRAPADGGLQLDVTIVASTSSPRGPRLSLTGGHNTAGHHQQCREQDK